jgi:hypothetical protein
VLTDIDGGGRCGTTKETKELDYFVYFVTFRDRSMGSTRGWGTHRATCNPQSGKDLNAIP